MSIKLMVSDMEKGLANLNDRIKERIQLEQELVDQITPFAKKLRDELKEILNENASGTKPDLSKVNTLLETIVRNLTSGPFGNDEQFEESIRQVEEDPPPPPPPPTFMQSLRNTAKFANDVATPNPW
jgi:hypothetical protein